MRLSPLKRLISTFSAIFIVSGCAPSYVLTADSLLQQLEKGETVVRRIVPVGKAVHLGITSYKANGIDTLSVTDRKGAPCSLAVSPNLVISVTDTSGAVNFIHFDTMAVEDGAVTGSTSHIRNSKVIIPKDAITDISIRISGKSAMEYADWASPRQ